MAGNNAESLSLDPVLEARFEVLRVLGVGGMGTVYAARDRERDEIVALKTLRSRDADSLYRFKREFRALADLAHPNLVVLYELFASRETWAFSMELVHGTSLRQWLAAHTEVSIEESSNDVTQIGVMTARDDSDVRPRRRRRWTQAGESQVRDALLQFARGLSALHESGHVHRDVKPSNVMVTHDGRVVVLDFGVVAELGPTFQHDDLVVGTPSYMAPEQAIANAVPEPASDWYSFGIVLYEMLTGRRPFLGDAREILSAKMLVAPPPILDLAPHAPQDLVDLCNRLLNLDPRDRPTGPEILECLGGVSEMSEMPDSTRSMSSGPVRRREYELVVDAFLETKAGKPHPLLVGGPSGIGKTTLVESFLESADAIVLRGRCYARESVPYKALDTFVDSLSRWLVAAPPERVRAAVPPDVAALVETFPVLGRVPQFQKRTTAGAGHAEETRRRAFQALLHLLERLSVERPIVVFVDDLQWGDLDSAPFFLSLFALDSARIFFLGTFRDDEAQWSPLMSVLRGAAQAILLEPLPPEALSDIARSVLGASADESLIASIAKSAGGSPYFALELARQLPDERGVSTTVHDLIRARARNISPEARRLLESVAVAGAALDRKVVEQAAEVQGSSPLIELVKGHFLKQATGDRIDTMHDAVREALLAELDPVRQRALHRSLAEALTGDIHHAAEHWFLAFPDADAKRVFDACHEAGRLAAGTHAYDQAFEHLDRARLVGDAASLSLDDGFLRFCADVGGKTGQLEGVTGLLTALLGKAKDPLTRSLLRLAQSRVHLASLDPASAAQEALRGVAELERPLDRSIPRELVSTIARFARSRLPGGALSVELVTTENQLWSIYGLGQYFRLNKAGQLISLLRAVDILFTSEPSVEGVRWYSLCAMVMVQLRLRRPAEHLRSSSDRMAARIGTLEATAIAALYRSHGLAFLGNVTQAEKAMRECLDKFSQDLSNVDFHLLTSHFAALLMNRGHTHEAQHVIDLGLQRVSFEGVGRRLDNRHTYAGYHALTLAMLGRKDEGRHVLDVFGALVVDAPDLWRKIHWRGHMISFLVETDAPDTEIDRAIDAFKGMGVNSKDLSWQFRSAFGWIARHRLAHFEKDRSKEARARFLEARKELAALANHPTLRTKLLFVDGKFARLDGKQAASEKLLDEAFALARDIDDRLALYDIALERRQFDTAEMLARQGGWAPRLAALTKLRTESPR